MLVLEEVDLHKVESRIDIELKNNQKVTKRIQIGIMMIKTNNKLFVITAQDNRSEEDKNPHEIAQNETFTFMVLLLLIHAFLDITHVY